MSVLTMAPTLGDLLKFELNASYTRETVTLKVGSSYTRLGQMGPFRFEGVTQRSVIIEQAEGILNLLPTVPLGGPATVANRDARSMRSFTVPWIIP